MAVGQSQQPENLIMEREGYVGKYFVDCQLWWGLQNETKKI